MSDDDTRSLDENVYPVPATEIGPMVPSIEAEFQNQEMDQTSVLASPTNIQIQAAEDSNVNTSDTENSNESPPESESQEPASLREEYDHQKNQDSAISESEQDQAEQETDQQAANEGEDTREPENSIEGELVIQSGPYSASKLIKDIDFYNPDIPESKDAYPTSIESWESNIYIGTSVGEILHFFKIDQDDDYILISRQKINDKKTRPIFKILLLPSISRALVLNGSMVSVFMLPEFSSANIGKIKEVQDLSTDFDSLTFDAKHKNRTPKGNVNGVEVLFYTKSKIRMIRVQQDGLKLVKDINYPQALKGVRKGGFSVVANKTNYDLIDLNNVQKIPLFPVCNDLLNKTSSIEPRITPCGKTEYLLSCGTSPSEPSMGMIINGNGDISRGTISWPSYPSSICVDYPYAIGVFGKLLIVNSILDQKHVQEFELPHDNLKLYNVSHSYNKPYSELADIIRLSSLISRDGNVDNLDTENEKAKRLSSVSSSSLLYGGKNVWILIAVPRIIGLSNFGLKEESIDALEDEIRTIDKSTELGQIEFKFSQLLLGLIYFFTVNFDQGFDLWTDGDLDPQILVYIFGYEVYENLWIYDGLRSHIEFLKTIPKSDGLHEFLKLVLSNWLSKRDDLIRDRSNLLKSLEAATLQEYVNTREIIHIIQDGQVSLMATEASILLQESKNYYALLKLYEKMNDIENFCEISLKLIRGEVRDDLFAESVKELPQYFADYLIENCKDAKLIWLYGMKLIEVSPYIGLQVFLSDDLNVEVSEVEIIRALSGNTKIVYIETLIQKKNQTQFVDDLTIEYIESLANQLRNNKDLVTDFDVLQKKYRDLHTPKSTFLKFLEMEQNRFRYSEFLQLFLKAYDSLSTVNKTSKTVSNTSSATILETCESLLQEYKQLKYLIIIIEFKFTRYEKVLEILCEESDYLSCEMFTINGKLPTISEPRYPNQTMEISMVEELSERLIAKTFDEYLKIGNDELVESFLFRYNSELDLLTIVNKIHSNYSIQFLHNTLMKSLVSLSAKHSSVVLQKNLARSALKYSSTVLEDFKDIILRHNEIDDDEANNGNGNENS